MPDLSVRVRHPCTAVLFHFLSRSVGPTNGQRYGYVKLSQKEPFDWLYGNVSLTVLQNLDHESRSVSPDVSWTGITNLELRLKYTALMGGAYTEFGEKVSLAKLDASLAYSF